MIRIFIKSGAEEGTLFTTPCKLDTNARRMRRELLPKSLPCLEALQPTVGGVAVFNIVFTFL